MTSALRIDSGLLAEAIKLRRELHRIPETAWQEEKTARLLRNWLKARRIDHTPIAGTGTLATVNSGNGRVAAVRTDIDGLPIMEETELPFKSVHAGRMHACGHDVHMAIVSTCALLLARNRDRFRGTVKFFYQPAEEEPPGGADELIRQGAMGNPDVGIVFGLHVSPRLRTGKVGLRDGVLMAGVLDFNIEVEGRGGHGALPHTARDPIACAAAVVQQLQTIASRRIDPFEPVTVSIGKIEGGSARNIIPPSCRLYGTARGLTPEILTRLRRLVTQITGATARSLGCSAHVEFLDGYPPLINDVRANEYFRDACQKTQGARAVQWIKEPLLGGEDFARYLQHAPGAMFHLGVGNPGLGAKREWHHPRFMVDEDAIAVGVEVMANAVVDYLND